MLGVSPQQIQVRTKTNIYEKAIFNEFIFFSSTFFCLNAQATRMSTAEIYEGNTFVGFFGRGSLYTGGWGALPNALTLTYNARDFAIGGWRK